ncbi:hypothetical protein JCM33374_g6418 [Metschnikowia sp. JCM 33374]|nr:hypothetical protein JCM33374_g6418 [Metschnikowia sp. JCM 33374]
MRFLPVLLAGLSLGVFGQASAAENAPETQSSGSDSASDSSDSSADSSAEKKLPEELTQATFDSFTGQSLTFVEFYSPYCSHCLQLAPVWKETYFLTENEQTSSKIYMRQVNCVESGDLCEREEVNFYPNLRLYAPEKEGDSGRLSRFVDSYPAALARTPEYFRRYLTASVAAYNSDILDLPSVSEQMDIDLGLQVVAGEIDEPYFVGLFSSTNEQYERRTFPHSCLDCVEHRQVWDRLSNAIANSAKTAHLNCHSHPTLCEKLGFPHLARSSQALSPRYMMFLPKSAGLIRFDYTGQSFLPDMKAFAVKLATNSKYEEITVAGLQEEGFLKNRLPEKPTDLYYPISNKLALVFAYDISTVTPEDKAIMPYLLDVVTKLPFDITLYASPAFNYEVALESQAKGLAHYVSSDETSPDQPFDRQLHLSTSLTGKPTLYIFKENSLVPAIFQNFAIEDMRNDDKIENFIKKNIFPLYGELTPKNFRSYFFSKGSKNGQEEKVSITFLNTNDANAIKHTLFNLSMIAHTYHAEKNRFFFDKMIDHRKKKLEQVAELKAKKAKSPDIIEKMREGVPHLFDHKEVLFTYVDIVQYPHFAKQFGFNIDNKQYKSGDTIVVSKEQKVYWDTTHDGAQITSNRQQLRQVLLHLLSPTLSPDKTKLYSKLVGSPYHKYVRGADVVHQHGFFGYVLFFSVIFLIYQVAKRLIRKPTNIKGGIIGNSLAKND